MSARLESPDISEATLANEPTLSSEAADPTLPMLSTDPTDPIDSSELVDPMQSIELRERTDQREFDCGMRPRLPRVGAPCTASDTVGR
jgi:hypothetical protein